jgi:uncharacterized protein (DUF2236 family)
MMDPQRDPPEPFGPGTILWDGAGDYRMLLVLGGALIMQTMHPVIGAAVAQTGEYRTDPWGRLDRSLTSLQKWVYGGSGAIEEGKRLREFHKRFTGVDAGGQPWHALDAEPWAWVHNTAFERAITLNRYFIEPVTGSEESRLYDEVLRLGRILQVPDRMLPPTVEDYWAYFDDMVATKLENHPTAQDVLRRMLDAPVPPMIPRPLRRLWEPLGMSAGKFQRFVTVGTFPPAIRRLLGLEWSARDEERLRKVGRLIARAWPYLPERARYMPIAYRARRARRGAGTAA